MLQVWKDWTLHRRLPLTHNSNGANNHRAPNDSSVGAAKPPQVARVHHMSAEEAYEASEVVLGMCTIKTKPPANFI